MSFHIVRLRLSARTPRAGFSLIELLVAIGIIAILLALLLPAVQAARAAARRLQCRSHMKQIVLAMHNYHGVYGAFPMNTSFTHNVGPLSRSRSWMQGILPFIEKQALYDQINSSESIQFNREVAETAISLYCCPADTHDGTYAHRADVPTTWVLGVTNYKSCAGSNWGWGTYVFPARGRFAGSYDGCNQGDGLICEGRARPITTRFRDVTDGTSTTYALGETVVGWTKWAWWYSNNAVTGTCAIPFNYVGTSTVPGLPSDDWTHAYGFASRHEDGGNFAMVDGSVRFVSELISHPVYRDLATIQGGEVISEF